MTNDSLTTGYFAVNPLEFGRYVVRAQYDPWDAPKESAIYRAMAHTLHTAITHDVDGAEIGFDDHGSPVMQGYAFTCTATRGHDHAL